ncbi:uncharacterized protein Dwil_GK28232 [Drosophila willistoni]|uniref:Uncharacterized protein n=1 Tax=Drosophila willistoni TaxID=7260 RepID=A0A0Q9X5U1_DROWI|nr:uncharacterized protein Dwil_GK28232 [Drosophila willistoni]
MNHSSSSSSNPNQAKPLNLLSKTLPLTAATPPQLRARRQFSFNGMHFETNGLHRIKGGGGAAAGLTVRPDANQSSGVLHYQNQQQQQQPQPQPQLPRSEDNGDGEKMLHTSRISLGDRASQMSTFRKRMQRMPWHKTDAIGDRAGGGERPSNFVPGRRFAPSPSETFPICERDDGNRQDNSKLDNYYNTNENEQEEEAATAANSRIISHGGSSYRRGAIGDGNSAPRFVLNQSMLARGAGGLGTTLHYSKMDYITLIGFLLGCIMSNILFFLCWYFSWLKCQVIKLRKHFLGHANLWDFFDFEDTTRYSMQTKLILAPIIVACSLLYCVVNVLHLMFKLVRADVPRTVVDVVQRVANSGLLSNGGRYRWS